MELIRILLLMFVLSFSGVASAQTAQLSIEGDLVIHPDQIAGFFDSSARTISETPAWDWPELKFTKPYKTSWTAVQAKGPFQVAFATEKLSEQEVGFELSWADPTVTVGRFEIHDTIIRKMGTNTIIVALDGACSGMSMRFPRGNWSVKGSIKWDWMGPRLQVAWRDFTFEGSDQIEPEVDLGDCQGPAVLHEALHDTILRMSKDREWMQDVMREGILDWVETTLAGVQTELMKPRQVEVKKNLQLGWQPILLTDGGRGKMRVAGHVVMSGPAKKNKDTVVTRSYDDIELDSVRESGFVLPKNTIQAVLGFLEQQRQLGYRVASREVESFTSLMQSRFLQFFVWPDLMQFRKSTNFWFDIGVSKVPELSNGRMTKSGLVYNVQAPLVVHQWAPSDTEYLPYMDFRSDMSGKLVAKINDGKLSLSILPKDLELHASVRSEFASKVRGVNGRISTSLLGSRASDYLSSHPFSVDLPVWEVGRDSALGVRDLQLHEHSLRIPLELKNNK